MKKAYFIHHLGLGDHIVCNTIYRSAAAKYNMCVIPVKQRNLQSLSDMLRDLDNIHFIPLEDNNADLLMIQQENQYRMLGFDVIKLGHFGTEFLQDPELHFDANFYLQADIDFEERWTGFDYPRNLEDEYKLYEQVCGDVEEGDYIFLHEDPSRDDIINRNYIEHGYKITTPGIKKQHILGDEENGRFFNYGYILENAAAIHCIESSFAIFADSLDLSNKKHIHRYARYDIINDNRLGPTYKSDWNIWK